MSIIEEKDILNNLLNNEALFRKIHIFNQKFDILPDDNEHYGTFIEYQDIQELRKDFLEILEDSIVDWVYNLEKFKELREIAMKNGKSEGAASSEVTRRAKNKFRGNRTSEDLLIQGQFGELLLFHFIQRLMKAVPLLRKMKITTSTSLERFGADAIHYKVDNGKNIIILGEAKTYTSDYQFNTAFYAAIESILKTYENHREEIKSYLHEDFLDKNLNTIAEEYINGTLESPEIHLVSIITYNETDKLNITNEFEIREQIKNIIKKRYNNFDNNKINILQYPILKRITYIVFPVWELEDLAKKFQNMI